MQKKLRTLFVVASLSLAASLVIVACGDGIPEILEEFSQEVGVAEGLLNVEMEDPKSPIWSEAPPVSSDAPPVPGSSAAPNPGSSAAPGVSSSADGGNSSPAPVPSSSSANVPKSSATAATGCKENNPKAGFTCGWNETGAALTPGVVLKPVGTAPAGCDLTWKYLDDKSPAAQEKACKAVGGDISAEGSKTYLLFAALTCDDGAHTNACGEASTKEAPYLTGTCSWKKSNGDTVDLANGTTTARGAIPGGVTFEDKEKVCGNTKPDVVYKYDGGTKTWPKEGGPLPEAKTYSDVQATVTCGTPSVFNVTPITCPALIAKAGADFQISCKGSQINATACNKTELAVQVDQCIDLAFDWTDANSKQNVKLSCSGQFPGDNGKGPNSSISIKVGSKPAVSSTGGSYYTSVETVVIPNTPFGLTEVNGICVSFKSDLSLPPSVTCKLTL